MKTLTPYQQGWQQGYWDAKKLKEAGWSSASEALANAEQRHAMSEKDSWTWIDQAKATLHREFLQGVIHRERDTLKALIEQGC